MDPPSPMTTATQPIHLDKGGEQNQQADAHLRDVNAVTSTQTALMDANADPANQEQPQHNSGDEHDDLMRDSQLIVCMHPAADFQEVYAHLEARRHERNRVQRVIDDFVLGRPHDGEEKESPKCVVVTTVIAETVGRKRRADEPPAGGNPCKIRRAEDSDVAGPSGECCSTARAVDPPDAWAEEKLRSLVETFPDADPVFLEHLAKEAKGSDDGLCELVQQMLETSYPKRKAREERERRQALLQEYRAGQFTIDEILGWYENPLKYCYDQTRPISGRYKSLVRVHLKNAFKKIYPIELKMICCKSKYHLAPALRLARQFCVDKEVVLSKRRGRLRDKIYGGHPDLMFYKDLAICRAEDQIRDAITTREQERERRLAEGRRDGCLVTCLCCYDEEVFPEDMVDCERGHMFCKDCVQRGVDVGFGQGRTRFDCMADNCTGTFGFSMLQKALKPNVFSNWLKKCQEDEILKADIPDLVQCPFCTFAAIVSNPDDKVFRCLDPDCLKESCRLCKEVSHIPLRCDEVEKELEVKLRTGIENELTEALLRKCDKCQRCFVKISGCNKMTCPCGAYMCYVCKKQIQGYEHFSPYGPCPQFNDTARMEADQVAEAARNAREVVIRRHPELSQVEMKIDPTKTVASLPEPLAFPAVLQNNWNPFQPGPAVAAPLVGRAHAAARNRYRFPFFDRYGNRVAHLLARPVVPVAPVAAARIAGRPTAPGAVAPPGLRRY